MWHIKNVVVFYYEAKIIIEMQEKLLTRNYFFSRIYSSMDKLLSFQEEKYYKFFLYCARESKGKDVKIITNPRFYFTDTRKQIWNYCTAKIFRLEKGLFLWVVLIQAVVSKTLRLIQNIFLLIKYYAEKISLITRIVGGPKRPGSLRGVGL